MTRPQCTIDGCPRPNIARGLCGAHYQRLLTDYPMDAPMRGTYKPKPPCAVDGCERPVRGKGLCSFHHLRQWQGKPLGDPLRQAVTPGTRMLRDELGRKKCSECEEWLELSQFGPMTRAGDGLRSHCRPCGRFRSLKFKYGISRTEFERLLAKQGDACAICRSPKPGGRNWCIDHDHSCCATDVLRCGGKCVRGILCDPCNNGLGRFQDSSKILRSAADYLDGMAKTP